MKAHVFTSTIAPELFEWVSALAKKKKVTKRAILESALENYRTQVTKSELEEGFKKAAQNKKAGQLAEAGLADYLNQLSRHP